ncbi:hypothetical protein [Streptomyces sp. NPDC056305]|uniref:hypothetical protein n=1 Tax=unclassified Streptomyces TaxID=2593676 RepID=UPI0035D7A1E1
MTSVVRREVIKHEIASMMAVVDRFIWPSFKVELEVIAAKPPTSCSQHHRASTAQATAPPAIHTVMANRVNRTLPTEP